MPQVRTGGEMRQRSVEELYRDADLLRCEINSVDADPLQFAFYMTRTELSRLASRMPLTLIPIEHLTMCGIPVRIREH